MGLEVVHILNFDTYYPTEMLYLFIVLVTLYDGPHFPLLSIRVFTVLFYFHSCNYWFHQMFFIYLMPVTAIVVNFIHKSFACTVYCLFIGRLFCDMLQFFPNLFLSFNFVHIFQMYRSVCVPLCFR